MASCPNCGFDLSPEGICAVCGYGKKSPPSSSAAPGRRRRATALIGVVAGAAVLVAAGVFAVARRAGRQVPLAAANPPAAAVASAAAQGAAPGLPALASTAPAVAEVPRSPSTSGSRAQGARVHAKQAAVSASQQLSYRPATYEDNPYYHVPVGASPVAVRATRPINLYDPGRRPVFDLTTRTQFPPLESEKAFVDWMLAHTHQSKRFLEWRWQRAQTIVGLHLVTHKRVLMAFLLTPREWFVRSYNLGLAYANTAIPIGFGQTISGPELVAHMTDALDPRPNQRVLEIGTGSGYQSAVLSELSNYVYTIEIVKPLAEQTNAIYLEHTKAQPQYANIHRRAADGYYGWPRYAPFDRIIVTTGIDHIPPILLQELKPGGIMLIPIGPPTGQVVLKITKTVGKNGHIHLKRSDIYHTPSGHREIFVPFTAAGGGTHNLGSQTNSRG